MTRHAKLGILVAVTLVAALATGIPIFRKANAVSNPDSSPISDSDGSLKSTMHRTPVVVSGSNVYVVWSAYVGTPNKNADVMFRESTDNGKTFSNKINLSNSNKSDSVDAMIDADGDSIAITWWERNATSNEPVIKISNDNGKTFGPLLKLSTNGTIGGGGG